MSDKPSAIVGAVVHIVTFEGRHGTDVQAFSTDDRARQQKAAWYRGNWHDSEPLPEDDDEAIERFEATGSDYRAHINSAVVEK